MEKRKNTPEYLTARSVKETFDARMDGICYASMEGQPILVNRQMNEICGYLFQTEIMNANVSGKIYRTFKLQRKQKS